MRLAAVVGLVVEEMGDKQPPLRRHLAVGGAAEPGQVTVKPSVIDPRRPALDISVAPRPGRAQFAVVLDHMGTLLNGRLRPRPVVEARHPLTVAPQDVYQRAVDRAPERTARGAPLGIRQLARG